MCLGGVSLQTNNAAMDPLVLLAITLVSENLLSQSSERSLGLTGIVMGSFSQQYFLSEAYLSVIGEVSSGQTNINITAGKPNERLPAILQYIQVYILKGSVPRPSRILNWKSLPYIRTAMAQSTSCSMENQGVYEIQSTIHQPCCLIWYTSFLYMI